MTSENSFKLAPGTTHLSVVSGSGGTTLGLQISRELILKGKHVFWISQNMPDPTRFSQLFSDVPFSSSSKLHISEGGEKLEFAIISTINVVSVMNNVGAVIIDDWLPRVGRASKSDVKVVSELSIMCKKKNVSLLLISSAYEHVEGDSTSLTPADENWQYMVRGKKLTSDFVDRIWWLNLANKSNLRHLWIEGQKTELRLENNGFSNAKNFED